MSGEPRKIEIRGASLGASATMPLAWHGSASSIVGAGEEGQCGLRVRSVTVPMLTVDGASALLTVLPLPAAIHPPAAMSTAFDRFDFADSDGWREVERNIYFSNNNIKEQERILLKRKRK